MMEYRGYTGRAEYGDEARLFYGEVMRTRAVLTFQSTTVDEFEAAFRDTVIAAQVAADPDVAPLLDDEMLARARGVEPETKQG